MSASVKAWLLLGGIFIVGVVTGYALTFGFALHFHGPRGEADMRTHMMAQYVRRLNLTDDQRAQIAPIVRDTAHNIQELHRDEVGRGFEIFHMANQKILAILTPEQKAQLQRLEQEQDMMFSNRPTHPGGPPHDGPGGMPGMFRSMNQPGSPPPPPPTDGQTNTPPTQAP
jgi:Spy/CpxP family protein refolding chaperone